MTSRYLQTHGSGAILTEQIQINTIIEISLGLRQLLASYLPGKLLLNFPDSTQMSPLPQAKLITSSFISHSTQKLHVLKKKKKSQFFSHFNTSEIRQPYNQYKRNQPAARQRSQWESTIIVIADVLTQLISQKRTENFQSWN